MDKNLLTKTGEALYGSRWQTELAHDLDISYRHMRRLVSGEVVIGDGYAMDLWRLVLERVAVLDNLVEELKNASVPIHTEYSEDTANDR